MRGGSVAVVGGSIAGCAAALAASRGEPSGSPSWNAPMPGSVTEAWESPSTATATTS